MGECERILKMAEERHKRLEKAIGLDFDTDIELDKMDGGITNQEYIQNCTTEELAEWVKNVTRHCYACGYDMARNGLQTKTKCPFGRCVADDAEVWLKEKKK